MALDFNADDAFEMAEQIERKGGRFYRKAAKDTSHPQTREVLLDLAHKEDEHLKVFVAMRKRLSEEVSGPTAFDPYGEASLYLQAMADAHVFGAASGEDLLTGGETPAQILKLALGFEKDTIAFFVGIRVVVPERLGKPQIERLINEEMEHVVILNQALSALG